MNQINDGNKESKTHTGILQSKSEGFYLANNDSATVTWYNWFICYLNKSHIFTDYFDKDGNHRLKCVRCGVEKIKVHKGV